MPARPIYRDMSDVKNLYDMVCGEIHFFQKYNGNHTTMQVQTPKYKSRHLKYMSRHLKYMSRHPKYVFGGVYGRI